MDYKKKYEDALKRAKDVHTYYCDDREQLRKIESIFPELTESKDERIRNVIRGWLYTQPDSFFDNGISKEEMFAWLKKQGQEKHLSEPIKDYQGSFTCWNNAHDFRPKHLQRCICYDKYMEGVYCCVYDDISKYWCTQTTEEHDSDGDNHICDYADYRITLWMPLPDTSFYPSKSLFEKQGKKKPINNTGPKFHEGEWVVNSATLNLCHILRVEHGQYICDDCLFPITKENEYHLWTIADAKPCDVLVHNDCTFIFMGIEKGIVKGICAELSDTISNFGEPEYDNDYFPATKEQRDLLFQKMKELGYEWDIEKKEIKKIVEPNFKIGDWCIDNEDDTIFQIVKVLDNTYAYKTIEGKEYSCTHYSLENDARLWTIADAKDGDVLVSKHNQPFIYNGIFDEESVGAYCGIDKLGNDFLIDTFSCDWSYKEGVKPAIKEQRDTLFAKMKEAGYVWDAEKKELKKIEQSELTEFEDAVKDMMNAYRDAIGDNDVTTEEVKKHATYLLSLIPHKPIEWSEDDEKNLNDLDVILFEYKHMAKENYWHMINWLKSLKERIGG